MPDLERRLREELNMVPSDVQWVTAWSIRSRELDGKSLPFLKTMAEVLGWPLNRYETLALLIFSSVLAVDLWFWELLVETGVNWASFAGSWIDQFSGSFLQKKLSENGHSEVLQHTYYISDSKMKKMINLFTIAVSSSD